MEVTHGRAMMAGPNQIDIHRADGGVETVTTRFTLIATGSRPARPAWVDFDHPCIVDADGLLELPKMPRSIVIIGGGVIGPSSIGRPDTSCIRRISSRSASS